MSATAADAVLAGGRVLTPDGVRPGTFVRIGGGEIREVAEGRLPPEVPVLDLRGAWVLPGYVDLHVHGGGGHSVADSPRAMAGAVAFHRAHGTTATLVSLVTAAEGDLVDGLSWAAALARRGPGPEGCVLGAHLEGPFLAPARRGAQNAAHMLAPDPAVLERLLAAGEGFLRMMTLAPELPGAPELIGRLRAADVVAALGHSDASAAQAQAGIDAGATHVTHLFNGMAPLHHREPGLAGAALARGLSCELIVDGRHLHPTVVALVERLLEAPILVTDAIDATGVGDGVYDLGGQEVRVRDGEARLLASGALAGSTLTMDEAVRRAVRECGFTLERASRAASGDPARVIGWGDRIGSIAPGHRADLVVLDDELRVLRTMLAGAWSA